MKRSEKLLATILLVCVGVFVVAPWVWKAFRGPVAEQEGKLARATDRLQKTLDQFNDARTKVLAMSEFKERSLSSNSAQGALAYQQWLTDLTEIVASFSDPEVTPERISPSKDNSYVSVRLRVTGKGTIDQLRTFLYRFHRANVLHRITSMTAEALNNSARPSLRIRITAEALALRDAPEKGPTLFPRSEIASVSEDQASQIELASTDGFPEAAPFEIRIGSNYYNVADIDGLELLLETGEDKSVDVKAGQTVELSPVHSEFASVAIEDFDELIKKNPFAKPAPYRPRLDLIGSKSVQRGGKLSLSAKVSGADPSSDEPVFEILSELVDGMTFDAGKLGWEPPAELAAGSYSVKVKATGGGLREPIESEIQLTLSDVNNAPKITVPDSVVATAGQAVTVTLSATDEETPEGLKFALGEGVPEGASIDAASGEFTWTPSADSEPGEVTIAVSVTDAGSPAQTATGQLKITVQDDKAQFTFMTGAVAADDDRQVWLRDQSTNQRLVLREGEELKYAGFDAIVLSIGDDFMLLQQQDETLQLRVGQNLRQAVVIARAEPDRSPATTEDTSDEASAEGEAAEDEAASTEDPTTEPVPVAPPMPEEASQSS